MSNSTTDQVGRVVALGGPWPGVGPFLFAVHHLDNYPRGNAEMGPAEGLAGRQLGSDFNHPSGWSMYHGQSVPGFPAHPHRGFETITLVNQGFVDHTDSTGASARYGAGDVQWVTAGHGVSHAEMFPLLNEDRDNPFELYQVWLNLPARSKGVPAEFTMQWSEQVPAVEVRRDGGGSAHVKVIAGSFGAARALAPPSASWAADPAADVAIWLIRLEPHAEVELPETGTEATQRMLYVHGTTGTVDVAGADLVSGQGFEQTRRGPLVVRSGEQAATVLVLQGVPIGEPVVQHGPFVMNTREEIVEAFEDYERTQFGGWQWPSRALVHPRETPRFARFGDGSTEYPAGDTDLPS